MELSFTACFEGQGIQTVGEQRSGKKILKEKLGGGGGVGKFWSTLEGERESLLDGSKKNSVSLEKLSARDIF